MGNDQLTRNFRLHEFLYSDTATARGIINRPEDPMVYCNIQRVALLLQDIRTYVQQPIIISSGYRCDALNRAVGGSPRSVHKTGRAVDFRAKGMTVGKLATQIVGMGFPFDKLLYERGEASDWIHLSIPEAGDAPKREVLTAIFKDGKPRYVHGIEKGD